jgi:catalase (peroxidase I)
MTPSSRLNLQSVKKDLAKLIRSSNSDWPSDFDGNYGGLFIRQAWHCAGSYRCGMCMNHARLLSSCGENAMFGRALLTAPVP